MKTFYNKIVDFIFEQARAGFANKSTDYRKGYVDALGKVNEIIRNHKGNDCIGWVSVKDALPPIYYWMGNASELLIFVDEEGLIHREGLFFADNTWRDFGKTKRFKATHWMIIPSVPKNPF